MAEITPFPLGEAPGKRLRLVASNDRPTGYPVYQRWIDPAEIARLNGEDDSIYMTFTPSAEDDAAADLWLLPTFLGAAVFFGGLGFYLAGLFS